MQDNMQRDGVTEEHAGIGEDGGRWSTATRRDQPIEDDWCHNRFSIYKNKDYTSQIFRNLEFLLK